LLASQIKNITVHSKDMVNPAKVKDLEFDPKEMRVTNIMVEFQKDAARQILGKLVVFRHAKGRVPVSWIESIKDALNLN
jgi:sporulation protein YlmC with PRC-barrel domain